MSTMLKPVLRYPGAKWRIAEWIVGNLPPHRGYVEPFAGSAAILLSKPRSTVECLNDLDGDVVNFFQILRDEPDRFAELVALTPYSRAEYDLAHELSDDPLERARRWIVRCNFSRAGKLGSISGMKVGADGIRTGQLTGCPARTWAKWPERMIAAAERLRGVQIERKPAIELIRDWNQPKTLIYADPPYVSSTTVRGDETPGADKWARYYRHTMSDDDHSVLIDTLEAHIGPVVLSGYRSELYDDRLTNWRRLDCEARAYSNAKRVESIWLNPAAAGFLSQPALFEAD